MSRIVLDAIAAEVAKLERRVEAPTGDLGYGTDLSCVEDLAADFAEVDPFSPRAIAEALVRRFDTPRGTLPDASSPTLTAGDYGFDLKGFLHEALTPAELRGIEGAVRTEALKDDRVESVEVTVTVAADGSNFAVDLVVLPVDSRIGGFALTFAVTTAAILIEELRT